ncbi:hypothetical protein AAVH_09070 [Aphelenchoides avenae]|nr:hypothetical protein AAVH_09070 [Aphelenchus avenae]
MMSGTRKMHDDLNRALIAYALCPMVASGLPLTFCIVDVFIADAAESFLIFACTVISSIAIWNPITTCLLIRPYRAVLIRFFRGKNHEPKAVTTVTSTAFSSN